MKRWIWIVFHPRATAKLLDERQRMIKEVTGYLAQLQAEIFKGASGGGLGQQVRDIMVNQGQHIGDFNFGYKGQPHVSKPPKS